MKPTIIKQKTLNTLIVFAFLLVVILVLVNTFLLRGSINQEIRVERSKTYCENVSREILDTSDYMTNEMRCFVVTQNTAYLKAYLKERYENCTYAKAIETLEQEDLTKHEQEALEEIKRNSTLTMNDEIRAIRLIMEAKDISCEVPEDVKDYVLNVEDAAMSDEEKILKAQEVLFNGDYTFEKETIRQEIESFQSVLKERFDTELKNAENHSDFVFFFQTVIIVLMCPILVFIFLLVYRYFTKPIINYSKELERCTKEDDMEPSEVLRPEGSAEVRMFADKFNELLQQMQKASRIKSEFLANMSHEIRTPLNTLTGYHFLLEQTKLDPEQLSYVTAMKKADELLQQNINNILDYSKLSSSGQQLERREFDIYKMLDNLESVFHYSAAEKGIYLRIKRDERLPRMVKGDMGKLRQILANLIGNAIKFTQEGSVTVAVHCGKSPGYGEDDGSECYEGLDAFGESDRRRFWLNIAVADTGIGIPKEDWERIFLPFEQVTAAEGRSRNGTGLGLAICRNLTQIMGGQIYLVERRVGSCFVVNLPMKRMKYQGTEENEEQKETERTEKLPQYAGKYVLLVDDNRINQIMEKKILEMFGLEVDVASCGTEAVAKGRAERYDLIFMDIYMDDMDGFTALEKIRQGGCSSKAPVVALTADVEKKTLRRCMLEMDGYVLKPIQIPRLTGMLKRMLGEANQSFAVSEARKESSDLVKELKEMFFANHEADFVWLAETVETAEKEEIAKSIHKLKGASATAELYVLSEKLAEMEQLLKADERKAMQKKADGLLEEFERLSEAYRRNEKEDERAAERTDPAEMSEALREFVRLLEKNDFEALEVWETKRKLFMEGMPVKVCYALKRSMQQMDFAKAYEVALSYLEGRGSDV